MADETPARDQDKFVLRLPDGMRDRIATAAKENKRSMNAEIVARLQYTFGIKNPDFKTPDVEIEFMKILDSLAYMMKNQKADGSVLQIQILANKPIGDEDEKRGIVVDPNFSVPEVEAKIKK